MPLEISGSTRLMSMAGSKHSSTSAHWRKGEQSTALATATDSSLEELSDWNSRYRQKFRSVFLIFASGRNTPEILAELNRRYQNKPLVEFEIAAGEQMKITELRLAKLFSTRAEGASTTYAEYTADVATKAGDRVSIIGAHLAASSEDPVAKPSQIPARTSGPSQLMSWMLLVGLPVLVLKYDWRCGKAINPVQHLVGLKQAIG